MISGPPPGKAVLEIPAADRMNPTATRTIIVGPGEREGQIAVLALDCKSGSVTLNCSGTNLTLALPPSAGAGAPAVHLTNAPLPVVLKLYREFTGLTLLEHPVLSRANLTIIADTEDRAVLATVFATALTNAGIVSIPDGEKFLRIVPAYIAASVQSQARFRMLATNEPAPAEERFPSGAINFVGAKGVQVAMIYAEMAGKKLDLSTPAPPVQDIVFRNQQPLTRAEILHALDVHFAWRGVKMLAVGEQQVRLALLNEQ
jgi:hypothetical protein